MNDIIIPALTALVTGIIIAKLLRSQQKIKLSPESEAILEERRNRYGRDPQSMREQFEMLFSQPGQRPQLDIFVSAIEHEFLHRTLSNSERSRIDILIDDIFVLTHQKLRSRTPSETALNRFRELWTPNSEVSDILHQLLNEFKKLPDRNA